MAIVLPWHRRLKGTRSLNAQKITLAAKKLSGTKLGRQTGPCKFSLVSLGLIEALLFSGSGHKYIAERYRLTEATLSNWIKRKLKKIPKAVL